MDSLEEVQKKFTDELREVDDVAQIVLKGHLVMESLMTKAIETFLMHSEFVDAARLQVYQKIALCRAMSTSDQNNRMWSLISSVNTVRNALSHSLDIDRRSRAIQKLRSVYEEQFRDVQGSALENIEKSMPADSALCLFAIAGSLGYLHAHLEEVKRFKSVVVELDAAMNNSAFQRKH